MNLIESHSKGVGKHSIRMFARFMLCHHGLPILAAFHGRNSRCICEKKNTKAVDWVSVVVVIVTIMARNSVASSEGWFCSTGGHNPRWPFWGGFRMPRLSSKHAAAGSSEFGGHCLSGGGRLRRGGKRQKDAHVLSFHQGNLTMLYNFQVQY